MSALLQQLNIFKLCPLITNLNCKLSTISEYDACRQLLCLVTEENDIVLRYTSEGGQEVLKLISWFRRANRVIHDVCFDPTGTWLLVLCFDNTLHIVPALAVVDKTFMEPTNSAYKPQQPYSTTQLTSYIIPFVGPHECPNSKKCPNQNLSNSTKQQQQRNETTTNADNDNQNQAAASAPPSAAEPDDADKNLAELHTDMEKLQIDAPSNVDEKDELAIVSMAMFSHDIPESMAPNAPQNLSEDKTGNSQVMATSFMASNTCPYPLSVVWWRTFDCVNRAIIGYSDGSICFVALSPNCPFVASTAIENGSVVKLLICKDSTFESVMLLITSSLKQQFKLLLEQKAIKYIYPGDNSPGAAQSRDSDWQIVMPLKTNSNCSDPASDSSQLDEDVFLRSEDLAAPSTSAAARNVTAGSAALPRNQIPPPPPYSVAINRHQAEGAPTTVTATASTSSCTGAGGGGVRFSQQQLPELDDMNGRAGILPAARARLASLKSLGTKKLNAIKMRLSDNRQKLEDYMPENTLGSFAIMDSPSLTPELLGNSACSFYTIQNLRSTYLLSALHSQNNSLTVHSIDINLKPLFLYKIPRQCFDILISSNILYAIQYVDIREKDTTAMPIEVNTEKENRDTDVEKQENYADENMPDGPDLSDDIDRLMQDVDAGAAGSAETSATSSERSTNSITPSNSVNAVGVISSAMASLRVGDEDRFQEAAQLALFRFENETVLSLYQVATYRSNDSNEVISKEEKAKAFEYKDIRTPMDYVQFYESANVREEFSLRQMEIMKNEFPKINYDPCYVVTNKNVYYIQLTKEPFALFLDAAMASEWNQCREFCTTFDLSYETCIEFAGDYLLRRKKVTQALLTYNTARIKPIRTALKLAMFGQTCALMHLCAMALKITYLLKSKHFCHPIIKSMLKDVTYRHSEDIRQILPPKPSERSHAVINEGAPCSDYRYGVDDSLSNLNMSPSSQFHLANLLLITLAEKAVNDKNYMPLWNFLVTNTKYHTNMTSIVLCQSGLFSAALVLAKTRGVCIDTFFALISVVGQEFGWYTELNVCLYNVSEPMFSETITYLPQTSIDYFGFIQEKIEYIRQPVLKRLEAQLNPFSAVLRPVISHNSSGHMQLNSNDNNSFLFEFCKNLIETYLAVLIHMESQRSKHEHITNALSTFRITYEDNQFAIENSRFKPISAGCSNCACVVDGVAYFWGSNGVPCNYSVNKSSDQTEPAYAVKSLDLLSQLNLEVHTVKCGRQHTLVLTNNGLYAFGNNNLLQLGIGSHMQLSQQPMLVKALDGKNITILEVGQYHNAAVASGILYTWGWGVYGQLGHGNTENVAKPLPVAFFKSKKILQVSLGHAHSLVLCQGPHGDTTDLYVFGSNHFGQLGIGTGITMFNEGTNTSPDDENNCTNQVKSLVPIKIFVSTANLRLIHTKFFSNLAVDDKERMFCWGSSPQALRLANQIKRRANAKQMKEESQRREMSKRFEATTKSDTEESCKHEDSIRSTDSEPTAQKQHTHSNVFEEAATTVVSDVIIQAGERLKLEEKNIAFTKEQEVDESKANDAEEVENIEAEIDEIMPSNVTLAGDKEEGDDEIPITPTTVSIKLMEAETDEILLPAAQSEENSALEPFVQEPDDVEKMTAKAYTKGNKTDEQQQPQAASNETDPCEHMTPHLVDTTEVAGQILQISSGLFHFALVSSTCTLYTWGKNLEHQLGTADKDRRSVNKPSPIDTIERPKYVDCGADFTIVMTMDYVVKAFGGNSNGQCGRDLGPSIDKLKQRVVCLPATKRLMRFESQCVDIPVEINLPRPRIRLDNEPVRYLKFIPKYQPHFMQEAGISFDNARFERNSPSHQYKSTTQADSSENVVTGQDSDDMISSLENLSNNEANDGLVCYSLEPTATMPLLEDQSAGVDEVTPEEPSYKPLVVTDNTDQYAGRKCDDESSTGQCAIKNPACPQQPPAAAVEATGNTESTLTSTSQSDAELQALRHYIHYCLYVFHGLYNPDKIGDFSKERLEYRIRTLMLNFKFIDAFTLCLQDCDTPAKSLKIFEYFSKDTGSVPMRHQDLKYLIYYLLMHFLSQKFDLLECEHFFMADLDYYLLELAYVLYFNNNNTVLEQNLNQKFKSLIAQEDANNQNEQHAEHKLEDTDVIFDSLSVKFKTIVCQRLMMHCNN